jgi:hypothetical protein
MIQLQFFEQISENITTCKNHRHISPYFLNNKDSTNETVLKFTSFFNQLKIIKNFIKIKAKY